MHQIKKKNKKYELNINTLLLFLIPLAFVGVTAAKYIQEKNLEIIYEAKAFYFESDALKDNMDPRVYTYEKGNTTITLKLKNNIDELRISDVDITYSVEITDVNGNKVNDKNGKEISKVTGKLTKGAIDTENISFTNLKSGTYIVTAKSTKPYIRTLTGTFLIEDEDIDIEYYANDSINNPIVQLTVASTDYDGKIKITWPENIAPDNTDKIWPNIEAGYNGGSAIIEYTSNSEIVFKFFKKHSSSVYSKEDFKVERSE